MQRSILPWVGGKSRLRKHLIPQFPEHVCYVEPFAGAAWCLFGKDESKVEVLNDANKDLITLYRVLQHHLEEFVRYFKWALVSRDEFERLKTVEPDTMTDIQRSARFFYLQKLCFGGRPDGRTFGGSATSKPRLNLLKIEQDLSDAHIRLSRVMVECLPYSEVIQRYDRDETFFFVDPPYYKCESYYGKGMFERDDFTHLAKQLAGIKGKFLLTINDLPETREIFKDFRQSKVSVRCSVSRKGEGRKTFPELIVTNYEPINSN